MLRWVHNTLQSIIKYKFLEQIAVFSPQKVSLVTVTFSLGYWDYLFLFILFVWLYKYWRKDMMNQWVIQILPSVFIIRHLSTFCLWSFLSYTKFIVVLLVFCFFFFFLFLSLPSPNTLLICSFLQISIAINKITKAQDRIIAE